METGTRGSAAAAAAVGPDCSAPLSDARYGIGSECSRYGLKWAVCCSYAERVRLPGSGDVSANSITSRYFCAASAVTTAEFRLPLFRTMAMSLGMEARSDQVRKARQ